MEIYKKQFFFSAEFLLGADFLNIRPGAINPVYVTGCMHVCMCMV